MIAGWITNTESYLQVEEGSEGPDGDTPAEGEAVVVGGQADCEVVPQVQRTHRHHQSAHHGVQSPVRKLQVQRGANILLPVLSAGVAVVQLAEVAEGTGAPSRVQPVHDGRLSLPMSLSLSLFL